MEKIRNSLLLKLGITISDVNSTLAQSTINTAIANGLITDESQNGVFRYLLPCSILIRCLKNSSLLAGMIFWWETFYRLSECDLRSKGSPILQDVKGEYRTDHRSRRKFSDFSAAGIFAYTPTTPEILLRILKLLLSC
jgi:hypothetical protein